MEEEKVMQNAGEISGANDELRDRRREERIVRDEILRSMANQGKLRLTDKCVDAISADFPRDSREQVRNAIARALGDSYDKARVAMSGEPPLELSAGRDDDHSPAGAHAEHLAAALAPLPLRSTHG